MNKDKIRIIIIIIELYNIKMTQQNTAKTKRGDLTSAEREMLQVAAAGMSQNTKEIYNYISN